MTLLLLCMTFLGMPSFSMAETPAAKPPKFDMTSLDLNTPESMNQSMLLKVKSFDVSKLSTKNLCASTPLELPKEIHTLKIWASWCGPCIDSMKKTWKTSTDTLWLNIDAKPEGITSACDFLKTNAITIIPYHDSQRSAAAQIGTGFPVPLKLSFENNKVVAVDLGMSYDTSAPQAPPKVKKVLKH